MNICAWIDALIPVDVKRASIFASCIDRTIHSLWYATFLYTPGPVQGFLRQLHGELRHIQVGLPSLPDKNFYLLSTEPAQSVPS